MQKLSGLLGMRKASDRLQRSRLKRDIVGTTVYVIGDVHGCLDALVALEAKIQADASALDTQKLIVMLGDYVDRGPASSQVLDHLIAPVLPGFERICLTGNHELMMLDYLEGRTGLRPWMAAGAGPTLNSYGLDLDRIQSLYRDGKIVDDMIRESIPASHHEFLRNLPILVETPRVIMVHAGLRPGIALDRQTDEDLVSIRGAFHEKADTLHKYVVHGHTPVSRPVREGRRINIDTGAFYSGRLTALRIHKGRGRFLIS